MATCYVCEKSLEKENAKWRTFYTGASVGGFNLSSNVVLNVVLNSIFAKRRTQVRSYYAQRAVCSKCAMRVDGRERIKFLILLCLSVAMLMSVIALVKTR